MNQTPWLGLLVAAVCLLGCSDSSEPDAPNPNAFAQADALIEANLAIYGGNVVLLVGRQGQLLHQQSWGSFTPATQRNVASASKLVSGAILLALQDRGLLDLDDSVAQYLPEWRGMPKGRITLRQLFAHTSGLPGDSPQGIENSTTLTLAQAVAQIAAQVPLERPIGSAFEYGGVSMHVAGRVAEVAGGDSWANLASDLLFEPCGMTNSVYSPFNRANPQIAGGLSSTPTEYLQFLEMLAGGGVYRGQRVLSQSAVDQLFTDQRGTTTVAYTPYPGNPYTPTGPQAVSYSVGAWLDVAQQGVIRELSSPGRFGTHPWVDRQTGTYGLVFVYQTDGWVNTGDISLRVRQAIRTALN